MDAMNQPDLTWTHLAVFIALVAFANAAYLWAMKWVLDVRDRADAARREETKKETTAAAARVERLEHDYLKLREELVRDYVRREDWIRFGTTISSKLDTLHAMLDALKEKVSDARHS